MQATLNLNLGQALSPEDLRQLMEIAEREGKSIEVVLFEAAKTLRAKAGFRRPGKKKAS